MDVPTRSTSRQRFPVEGERPKPLAGRREDRVADRRRGGDTRSADTAGVGGGGTILNDYSDAIVSAIHEHGGDVLKLIGDGTLAIFTAEDRTHACGAPLSAAIAAHDNPFGCGGQKKQGFVARCA
jgi:class 3 adenylate cyclase